VIKAEDIAWAALVGLAVGAFVALAALGGCTPEHRAAAMQHSTTAAKFGACAMNVLAEEEAERLRKVREEERQAEEEAANVAEAAREHPPSVKEEIEKVLRDGGVQ